MASGIVAYTTREKILLANLVDKHKLVENKKTDAATIQMKQREWERIASEYNSQGDIISVQRTSTQLKKLWNNLKQRKRKLTTEEKYTRLVTGGGPPVEIKTYPVMEAVDAAAPNADITIKCPWDSTGVYMRKNDIEEEDKENEIIHVVFEEDNPKEYEECDQPMAESSGTDATLKLREEHRVPLNRAHSTPKTMKQSLQSESSLRHRKLLDSIQQQAALYEIKLKTEEELLRKVTAERRKVEAEEQLALLKLKQFKEDNNL